MKAQFEEWKTRIPRVRNDEVTLYERHFDLLRSWNERMNLVSRNSLVTAFATHYVDSIHIAEAAFRFSESHDVNDLGSGAGFPGLIFAIRFPEKKITLFEKSLKKQSFLLAAVAQLNLVNVTVRGALPSEKFEGLFLGRAVMQRHELFPYFAKHLKLGGRLVANLGGQTPGASSAPVGFHLLERSEYALPLDCGNRKVEVYEYSPR